MEEPSEPEEEGELTACGGAVASIHFLKKLLRKALQLHPVATLGFCCSQLAAANKSSGRASSEQLQRGIRLWLKEYVLKPHSPSRETTPLTDVFSKTDAADDSNGNSYASLRCCCLKVVLDDSQELQAWVMQQAKGRATGWCSFTRPAIVLCCESELQLSMWEPP